jgi:hypothetical protein
MKSFVKDIFDAVFSFGGFMVMFLTGILVLVVTIGAQSADASARCVEAGMVKVHYDGANYCVSASNLTRVTIQ